jgi:1-acyl-sn-glycerol-3-phosphate acyltransferase
VSLFAGLYSVPMYALIQLRAQPTHRARIIAANNILNALFMIASAVIAGALLKAGFTIPQIFLFTGLANAVVALYIFLLVPEYLLRFVAWVLSRVVYRFKVRGDEHIPVEGAAIVVCNHVSFVDAVLLMAASPRPIVFMMDHRIFRVPVLGWLFRLAKAIPVAPQKEDPVVYEAAFERAAQVLRDGDLLGIFPEGAITRDGETAALQGRRDEGAGTCRRRRPAAAGGADGVDQPLGVVLQPHRTGHGDGEAVPARGVQPGRVECRAGGGGRAGGAAGAAAAGGAVVVCLMSSSRRRGSKALGHFRAAEMFNAGALDSRLRGNDGGGYTPRARSCLNCCMNAANRPVRGTPALPS